MAVLEFHLKFGHRLQHKNWLTKLKEEGRISKNAPEEPELLPSNYWLWNAFNRLTSQRQYAERGPQPIALSEMKAYAELYELSDYRKLRLIDMMLMLDRKYMEQKYKDIVAESKKQRSKGKRR